MPADQPGRRRRSRPRVAPEPAGERVPAQRRGRAIALLAVLLAQPVEHGEHVVEADRVGPRQRATGVVESEHHAGVDVRGAADALAEAKAASLMSWQTIRPSTRPARRRPTRSSAERREEALGALRRDRRGGSMRVSSTRPSRRPVGARGSRRARPPGSSAPSDPPRTAPARAALSWAARAPRAGAGPSSVASGRASRRGHFVLLGGAPERRARPLASCGERPRPNRPRPRRAAPRATTMSPATTIRPSPPPGAGARARDPRAGRARGASLTGVVVIAAAGLATVAPPPT